MLEPHERLEEAMNQRRVELLLSWRDVVRAADISYEGLRAIRRGERQPNPVTKRRLENALQWRHGSIDAILDGGQPASLGAHTEQPTRHAETDDEPDLEAMSDDELEDYIQSISEAHGEALVERHRRKAG